jgi:kinesin family protein 15
MIGGGYRGTTRRCISDVKEQKTIVMTPGDGFNFDYVGNEEVTQEEIFQVVGKPIVD